MKAKAPRRRKPLPPGRKPRANPQAKPVASDRDRLAQELDVHRVELEMQNEELRSARLEIESGLERFTELFDFAPIGYAELSSEGLIRAINHAGASLLGKARKQLAGASFHAIVSLSDRPVFVELCQRTLASETKLVDQLQLTGHGRTIDVRIAAMAMRRHEPAILVAFHDITELVAAQRALVESDRRKDEFIAALSHELRNPLSPIATGIFVLERVGTQSEVGAKTLAIMQRQVDHMSRLIDDLLDVTRITRGKIELHPERVELGDLVRCTVDDHRASLTNSGLAVEAELEPGLWVDGDPVRLVQVASNLLSNAEKFTPPGGCVRVSLQAVDGRAVLRVVDSGVGVDPEQRVRVFDAFAQAPQSIERSRGGLGLGLAIVHGIAKLHGGDVTLHSSGPGCGTEVTVSLPLVAAHVRPVAATPPPPRARRILVIEDSVDTADNLRVALELSGHDVSVAHDGQAGLAIAREIHPDVVVCDLGLPGMDGYQVAAALRADPGMQSTFLVALSGYATRADRKRSAKAGFDRHVAKPANIETLLEIVGATR
jgi:PAS domain S-box-containing protein